MKIHIDKVEIHIHLRSLENEEGDIPIEELGLTVRTTNNLLANGINTVAKLKASNPQELLRIGQLGKKSIIEIQEVLREHSK